MCIIYIQFGKADIIELLTPSIGVCFFMNCGLPNTRNRELCDSYYSKLIIVLATQYKGKCM